VIDKSHAKSQGQLKMLAILSFLGGGGGYVSFGYMTYLKLSVEFLPIGQGLPICLRLHS